MIKTFRNKETEKVYFGVYTKKISNELGRAARRKLKIINASTDFNDLNTPPGNRLEALYADREGQYSIRINDQYRICFYGDPPDAYEVEITDYH